MKKSVILIGLFILISSLNFASAAISETHPRVILDQNKLSDLRLKACYYGDGSRITGCTPIPEWAYFNSYITNYQDTPWHLAFAYLITKNSNYSTLAITLLENEIADGMADERFDQYLYVYGYIQNAALVYDWLYPLLTETQRVSYRNYINQLLIELWNHQSNPYNNWAGWGVNDGGNNYFYHHLLGTAYAGIALFNENPSPPYMNLEGNSYTDIMLFLEAKIQNQSIPWLIGNGAGGGWHEGNGYGRLSKDLMFEMFYILKESGVRNYFTELNFPSESLNYHLHSIQPGNSEIYMGGDLPNYGFYVSSYADRKIFSVLSNGLVNLTERSYAKFWLTNLSSLDRAARQNYIWDFLFSNSSLQGKNFSELPLDYYSEGVDWINSRSSWSGNATSFSFICTDRIQGHQHQDQNGFLIWKNGWQLTDATRYSHSHLNQFAANHNTFLINGSGQRYAENTGNLIKHEFNGNYNYVEGDASEAYYTNSGEYGSGQNPMLNLFQREVVHFLPDIIVVFDRLSTKDSNYKKESILNFANFPAINGNSLESLNGGGKVFGQILLPLNPVVEVVNQTIVNSDLSSWRLDISPQSLQFNDTFLNLFYVTNTNVFSMFQTSLIESSDQNMQGAFINNSWAVMFAKNNELINQTQYTLNSTGSVKNLVVDLRPSTVYYIYDNGALMRTATSSSQGTLFFNVSTGSHTVRISETTTSYHAADSNMNNYIELTEIMGYVRQFKLGTVTRANVLEAVSNFFRGRYN